MSVLSIVIKPSFLKLWRFVLGIRMWSVLENIPGAWGEKSLICYCWIEYPSTLIRFVYWWYCSSVSLLIFCLVVSSVTERGCWTPKLQFYLSISFNSASFCFMYLEARFFGAYTYRIFMSSWWMDPFIRPFVPDNIPHSEEYFIWY